MLNWLSPLTLCSSVSKNHFINSVKQRKQYPLQTYSNILEMLNHPLQETTSKTCLKTSHCTYLIYRMHFRMLKLINLKQKCQYVFFTYYSKYTRFKKNQISFKWIVSSFIQVTKWHKYITKPRTYISVSELIYKRNILFIKTLRS